MLTEDLENYFNSWKCGSFEDCATRVDEHLNYILRKHYPNTTPDELRSRVIEDIKKNKISGKSLREQYKYFIFENPGDASIACRHYIQTFFSSRLLAEKLHNNGDLIQALSMLVHCGICVGQLDVILEDQNTPWELSYDDERRVKIATDASNARHDKLKPAHEHLAELIRSRAPKDGWSSMIEAARTLDVPMEKFIEKNEIKGLKPEAIQGTIRSWMSKVPVVQAAISQNLQKKPSSS